MLVRARLLPVIPALIALGLAAAFVVLVLSLSGCTPADTSALREQTAAARVNLDNQKAQADAALIAAEESGDEKAWDRATKNLAAIAEIERRLAEAEALLNQTTNPDGSLNVGGAAAAVGGLLPPPWGVIAAIAIPAAVAGLQELRVRQKVRDAVSIIDGFSSATVAVPGMATALKSAKPVLKKEYTPGALKLVEKHKLKTA